jgi:hypothetical protein
VRACARVLRAWGGGEGGQTCLRKVTAHILLQLPQRVANCHLHRRGCSSVRLVPKRQAQRTKPNLRQHRRAKMRGKIERVVLVQAPKVQVARAQGASGGVWGWRQRQNTSGSCSVWAVVVGANQDVLTVVSHACFHSIPLARHCVHRTASP